jgi:predicted nucleotide-binding protein
VNRRDLELLKKILEDQYQVVREGKQGPIFTKWKARLESVLQRLHGGQSSFLTKLGDVSFSVGPLPFYAQPHEFVEAYRRGVEEMAAIADAAVADAEDQLAGDEFVGSATKRARLPGEKRRIFIVHGHSEAPMQAAARLCERLGFETIVLHEQPDQGRTIIEKFEDYSDVDFAVVLLTADDLGRRASAPDSETKPRARQNVVLELGFFVGRLGRKKVCALADQTVEVPSDYTGVLLVRLDADGRWKTRLAEEMKAADLPVDMNDVR